MTTSDTEPTFELPSTLGGSREDARRNDPGYVPGVDYDQYGRYMLPEPGGEPAELVPWTRVTTLAGMVVSQDGLRIWTERNIARGIGMRRDLRALLASAVDGQYDVATIDEVLQAAKDTAGIGESANWGRALHRAVENLTDPSRTPTFAPDPAEDFGRDVIAATECLTRNGITVRMVERLVVHETLGYAGRTDAVWTVTLPDGRVVHRIGDVKTGDKISKPEKRHSAGTQLGAYANATHAYDPAMRTFVPMAEFGIDRSVGYILSVREGVAQLYEIDLVTGFQCLLTAVKAHRQRRASVDMLPVGEPVRIDPPEVQVANHGIEVVYRKEFMPAQIRQLAEQAAPDLFPSAPAQQVEITPEFAETLQQASADLRGEQAPADDAERSPSGRKRRACSKCRQPGHTAKRCPGVEQTPAADAQPDAQAVDDGPTPAEQAKAAVLCPHTSGWTRRESDGAWVCPDCGRPSEATVEAMRTGGPLPVGQSLPPAVEGGATVARLDPGPEQAVPLQSGPAPVFMPPAMPWQTPAAPPVDPAAPLPGEDEPTYVLRQIRDVINSQEELGQLYAAHGSAWSGTHTEAAKARVAAGLPVLPPSSGN